MTKPSSERRVAYALAVGLLLFSVAMLLWGYEESTFALWGHEISMPWLVSVYKFCAEVLLVISVVPIVALFSERVQRWMERFVEARPTAPFQAVSQFLLWVFTTWIFVLEWTKGLTAVSGNDFYSSTIFCLGILWLVVLILVFLRPSFQRMREQFRARSPV